jgi:hypothetical protein
MSVRNAVALREGMTESTVAKIKDYENSDLEEKHKVALRLTDAFIFGFGRVSEELAAAAHRYFSDAELLDIAGKVFYSTSNKIRVALAIDEPEDVQTTLGIRTMEYPVAPGFVPRSQRDADPSGAI